MFTAQAATAPHLQRREREGVHHGGRDTAVQTTHTLISDHGLRHANHAVIRPDIRHTQSRLHLTTTCLQVSRGDSGCG